MSYKLTDNTDKYLSQLESNIKEAGVDILNDYVASAQSTAPHKTGQLEKGIKGSIKHSGLGFKIEVAASAKDSKGNDYAQIMHDGSYNLGAGSIAKGEGYSGISKQTFPVGSEYLTNPLESNFDSYVRYLESAINKTRI